MRNLEGMKWYQLTETEKCDLLMTATAIDGRTGNKAKETCECIVDLENGLSVSGYVEVTDEENIISVDEESIIYNAEVGVIAD